jgi:hypothetical protein
MKLVRLIFPAIFLFPVLAAAAAGPLTVEVGGVTQDGAAIPKQFAQCIPTTEGKSTRGENLRPTIAWSSVVEGVKSYAIVVSDPDVPADLSIANNEELLIADDMPRQTFYHWVQFNITPDVASVPGGDKPPGFGRSAANDVNEGNYKLGYGGPCPPWNDALVHRYHFAVHALDIARLPLAEGAPAKDAVALIEQHTIAKGELAGTFTNNPKLLKKKR